MLCNPRNLMLMLVITEDSYQQQLIYLRNLINSYNEEDTAVTNLCVISQMTIPHIRITDYYEQWLTFYIDSDFFNLFRMDKQTYHALLNILNCAEKSYTGGEQPIPTGKALLMTLWWLGRGEVLSSVSDKFNVSVSTVHTCSEYMLTKIVQLNKNYIVWPDANEARRVEIDFRARSGYPGQYSIIGKYIYCFTIHLVDVIGAIDVCNIKFKAPLNQQESYIDKNSNHSIKLQAIVTANKIFTNIMVGYPGSAHDSRVRIRYIYFI